MDFGDDEPVMLVPDEEPNSTAPSSALRNELLAIRQLLTLG
jgi:hypothetical protein